VPLSGIFRPTVFPFTTPPHVPAGLHVSYASRGRHAAIRCLFVDPNLGFVFGPATEDDEHPPTGHSKRRGLCIDGSERRTQQRELEGFDYLHHVMTNTAVSTITSRPAPAPAALEDVNPDGNRSRPVRRVSRIASERDAGQRARNAPSAEWRRLQSAQPSPISGHIPATARNFDQLGFRVPFIAVSPFSRPHYVSHTVGDHTSMLALNRGALLKVLTTASPESHLSLTERDENADPLLGHVRFPEFAVRSIRR